METRRENLNLSQTIFALASGRLPSAIAVIRLSGPKAFEIAAKVFAPHGLGTLERKRQMVLGAVHSPKGVFIDEGMVLSFVAPQSYTGEDLVEFQVHGSVAIVQKVEEELLAAGALPARRGEFSYRGLLNGKVSAQALDTLGDVFQAESPADLRAIYDRREGSLDRWVLKLRSDLIRVQAILDTAVDFVEEYSQVLSTAQAAMAEITRDCSVVIQRYRAFQSKRAVGRVVLAGAPNAGKSSLFNTMLARYRAIVDHRPGTTRDVIEEDIEVAGRRLKLVDTAGFREADCAVERQGVALGQDFVSGSSYWLLVVDSTRGIQETEMRLLEEYREIPHLVLWNKSDLGKSVAPSCAEGVLPVSALTAEGLDRVWQTLETFVERHLADGGFLPSQTHARRLETMTQALERLIVAASSDTPPEILSEEFRKVMGLAEELSGPIDSEEVLDRVFSDFCIGK